MEDERTPGAAALTGTAALSADIKAGWANLDGVAKLLVGASIAALVVTVIGLPLSVWDSAPMALLVMTIAVITAVTGWFGSHPAVPGMAVPLSTIELIATSVALVLAAMKTLEVLFDLDSDGAVGLVVSVALVVAAAAMVVAASRRGADLRGAILRGDQGATLAMVGLGLVILGWAFNLSVSFWTMGQAALPLAVLTIAALVVTQGPRIQSPVPVAWVGAAIAAFGAVLLLGNWNELTSLGRTELELDPGDFTGILAYSVGAVLIVIGGVMSGRSQWSPASGSVAPAETPASDSVADAGEGGSA